MRTRVQAQANEPDQQRSKIRKILMTNAPQPPEAPDPRHRASFVEELNTSVRPLDDALRAANEHSIAFAQTVIKSGFLLNGGGLVAVPAAVAMFNIDARQFMTPLYQTATIFVFGLLAMCLVAGCGFFGQFAEGANTYELRELQIKRAKWRYYPKSPVAPNFEVHLARSRRYILWFSWLRGIGIMLSFLSFGLFVAGAYIGGQVLLEAPPRAPKAEMSVMHPGND